MRSEPITYAEILASPRVYTESGFLNRSCGVLRLGPEDPGYTEIWAYGLPTTETWLDWKERVSNTETSPLVIIDGQTDPLNRYNSMDMYYEGMVHESDMIGYVRGAAIAYSPLNYPMGGFHSIRGGGVPTSASTLAERAQWLEGLRSLARTPFHHMEKVFFVNGDLVVGHYDYDDIERVQTKTQSQAEAQGE